MENILQRIPRIETLSRIEYYYERDLPLMSTGAISQLYELNGNNVNGNYGAVQIISFCYNHNIFSFTPTLYI